MAPIIREDVAEQNERMRITTLIRAEVRNRMSLVFQLQPNLQEKVRIESRLRSSRSFHSQKVDHKPKNA